MERKRWSRVLKYNIAEQTIQDWTISTEFTPLLSTPILSLPLSDLSSLSLRVLRTEGGRKYQREREKKNSRILFIPMEKSNTRNQVMEFAFQVNLLRLSIQQFSLTPSFFLTPSLSLPPSLTPSLSLSVTEKFCLGIFSFSGYSPCVGLNIYGLIIRLRNYFCPSLFLSHSLSLTFSFSQKILYRT